MVSSIQENIILVAPFHNFPTEDLQMEITQLFMVSSESIFEARRSGGRCICKKQTTLHFKKQQQMKAIFKIIL